MRVLFKFLTHGWGGNELMACAVARQVQRSGVEIRATCLDPSQRLRIESALERAHVEVVTSATTPEEDTSICVSSSFLNYLRLAPRRQPENEWVYTPFWGHEWAGGGIDRLLRTQVIRFARARLAPNVIGVHHAFGASVTFPNVPVHRACEIPEGTRTELLCLARIDFAHKQQDLLLRQWRDEAVSATAFLRFVGSGPDFERLQELAEQQRGVSLESWHDDPSTIYHSKSVCVLASRFEGLPLAGIEALASGVPVVCTAGCNLGEFLPPECLFELGAVGSLSRALDFVQEHRGEVIQIAQTVIHEKYSAQSLESAVNDWLAPARLQGR